MTQLPNESLVNPNDFFFELGSTPNSLFRLMVELTLWKIVEFLRRFDSAVFRQHGPSPPSDADVSHLFLTLQVISPWPRVLHHQWGLDAVFSPRSLPL